VKSIPAEITRLWFWKVETSEDILEVLQEEVRKNNISSGIFLSGIGSVSQFRVHVVKSTALPPGSEIFGAEGSYDLDSLMGFVIAGRVHVHIVLSDTGSTVGGHLEAGTIALTFCSLVFAETAATDTSALDDFPGRLR
jgi:predicted DNA-binding protein with PD1-like motif